jgi:predicted peroxiredoxin
MADGGSKAVINLTTGLEDPEKVMIAFLVGIAAAENGKQTLMFLTKEAVRLATSGHAVGTACDGCPPIERLFQQFADNGGELLVCPICAKAKNVGEADLVANARMDGATPLWQWIGDEGATVFSY